MADLITRQEACKRLTRAAIAAFVRADEPLMVHLAAQAAFRVCRDVIKHRDPSEDRLSLLLRPEMAREFWKQHAKIANFLKHAEREPLKTLDVENIHVLNEHELFLTCGYHWDAFPGTIDAVMWAFAGWYRTKRPELLDTYPGEALDPFARVSEQEAWGMLQTACDMGSAERARMASAFPGFDW